MTHSRIRVIPSLLLRGTSLVKTVQFDKYSYIGDPINTVRIFNELEVDELAFLDITASREKRKPSFKLLESIACECFMPLAYGGGITSLEDAQKIFSIGFEKVIINSANYIDPNLISKIAEIYGSQAVVASVDYKKNFFGKQYVYSEGGTKKESPSLASWCLDLEKRGAGELLFTSIDRDGTWTGYDLQTIEEVSKSVAIPLIANGGAGSISDLSDAIKIAKASAVAVGSMVVFQKKDMGVLVNFPDKNKLKDALDK